MSEDLLTKLQKDENFRKQNQKNKQKYDSLLQAATYSDTKNVPEEILKKVQGRVIYLYFGYLQPTIKKYMGQVAMHLVKNFQPEYFLYKVVKKRLTNLYFLMIFPPTIMYCGTLEQIIALQQFIVVKPYFYHKTMDWMTFGTLPKYIRSKTKFIYSYGELCQYLNLDKKFLIDYIPPILYKKQFPQVFNEAISLMECKLNVYGESFTHEQNIKKFQSNKEILSIIQKSDQYRKKLQEYEVGPEGVPTILKMLIFYFDSHQEGLRVQGLFRKSAGIDEQIQTINKIAQKNYDYILEVQNPHVIANLIKKFFNSLKIRVFPQYLVDELIDDNNIEDKITHLKKIYNKLPELNKITLIFLFSFLIDKVLKQQSYNKMSKEAISVCFNPCLFGDKSLASIQKGKKYCRILLENYQQIFGQQKQRNQHYRQSYIHAQQQFQQEVDLGLKRLTQSQSVKVDYSKGSQRVSHHFDSSQHEVLQFLEEAYTTPKQIKQSEEKIQDQIEKKQVNQVIQEKNEQIQQKKQKEQQKNQQNEKWQINNEQNFFPDVQQESSAWSYTRHSMQAHYSSIQDFESNDWANWKDQQNKQEKDEVKNN